MPFEKCVMFVYFIHLKHLQIPYILSEHEHEQLQV